MGEIHSIYFTGEVSKLNTNNHLKSHLSSQTKETGDVLQAIGATHHCLKGSLSLVKETYNDENRQNRWEEDQLPFSSFFKSIAVLKRRKYE